MRPRFASLMLLAAPLAACMTTTPDDARIVTYACERGPELTVVYWGDTAQIREPGAPRADLQRIESGSGVLYTSFSHKIRGEGEQITYQVGRAEPVACRMKAPQPA